MIYFLVFTIPYIVFLYLIYLNLNAQQLQKIQLHDSDFEFDNRAENHVLNHVKNHVDNLIMTLDKMSIQQKREEKMTKIFHRSEKKNRKIWNK